MVTGLKGFLLIGEHFMDIARQYDFKSWKKCILDLIGEFSYEDFLPENNNELYEKLKKVFHKDTPYWDPIKDPKQGYFFIEFKKYGDNRKRVLLKFCLEGRQLALELVNEDQEPLKGKEKREIKLSDIWKDHKVFFDELKNFIETGLELAAESLPEPYINP